MPPAPIIAIQPIAEPQGRECKAAKPMMMVKREAVKTWMTYEGSAKRPSAGHKHTAPSEADVRSHDAAEMRAAEAAKAASKMRRAETTHAAVHPSKAAAKAMHSTEAAEATSGSWSLRRYCCAYRQSRKAAEKLAFHSHPSRCEVERRAVATPRDATEGSGKETLNPMTNKSFSDKKVSLRPPDLVAAFNR